MPRRAHRDRRSGHGGAVVAPGRADGGTEPTLYVNPASDAAFRRAVEAARPASASPEQLQCRLRRAYPRTAVRARELEGELPERWYVYREGRWIP